jgi:hypothetical protein
VFNLRKHSFTEDGSRLPGSVHDIVKDELEADRQQLDTNKTPVSEETSGDVMQGLTEDQKNVVMQYNEQSLFRALNPLLTQYNQRLQAAGIPPSDMLTQIKGLPEYQRMTALPQEELAKQMNSAFKGEGGVPNRMLSDYEAFLQNIKKMLDTDYAIRQRVKTKNAPGAAPFAPSRGAAFNLQEYKVSQFQAAPRGELDERFPVGSVGEFIEKFLRDLMAWSGEQGERDAISNSALEAIRGTVGQGFEEEANSALKEIQRMEHTEVERAAQILAHIYQEWLSPMVKRESEKQVMSEKIDGIVKYNLSDHVLNNKEAQSDCCNGCTTKTASAYQSQEYALFGPEEKRVCPKLKGRFANGGDVVSEYICRHHCNMGLVFDDGLTACGEAIWRAHVMDKFSREYVDADGNIQGGYLNKRFEINRNVPEENKIRLKPGETRKPRPVELFGNLEARMQAMREKEGKERGYRPETDTSKPFNWTKDVDQNNVETKQSERDRREEASGHQLVQYTNKDEQENNPKLPKKGFNLAKSRHADTKTAYNLATTLFHAMQSEGKVDLTNPPEILKQFNPDELEMVGHQLVERQMAQWAQGNTLVPFKQRSIDWPPRQGFNLKKHKTAAEGAEPKKKS